MKNKNSTNTRLKKKRLQQSGATLIEFLVIAPTLLLMILATLQSGLVFHAKSNLKYAAFEAVRTGTMTHNNISSMLNSFSRAMTGYYGGGRTTEELAESYAKAVADINVASAQIQILSPTKESFDDYNSPARAKQMGIKNNRVIPNTNIAMLSCPIDRPSCNFDPTSNQSGQSLQDANLLKIKITYGIPASKQVPLVGRFYVKVLEGLSGIQNEMSVLTGLNTSIKTTTVSDAFKLSLLKQGRIPVEIYSTMRMQSEPIENGNISNPGAGNGGTPIDLGEDDGDDADSEIVNIEPPPEEEPCDPATALFGCPDSECQVGTPDCGDICEVVCCKDGKIPNKIPDIDWYGGGDDGGSDTPNSSTDPSKQKGLGVEIFTKLTK